jgi:hypothetical protein
MFGRDVYVGGNVDHICLKFLFINLTMYFRVSISRKKPVVGYILPPSICSTKQKCSGNIFSKIGTYFTLLQKSYFSMNFTYMHVINICEGENFQNLNESSL